MSLRLELKQKTSKLHEELESILSLGDFGDSGLHLERHKERYKKILCKFYGFYAVVEPRIVDRPEWKGLNLEMAPRRKMPWLEADLSYLGIPREDQITLRSCSSVPRLESFARILGCAYVIEGSTLGGAVLSRKLKVNLGFSMHTGASFFQCYGAELGNRWKEFVSVLDSYGDRNETSRDEVSEAAIETFQCLRDWFRDA